ncbi:unnamed protein product [Adineta ricciae]|uniref:Cystatin domain-containing protein n=1 Tax=Adineta ricciae TaxID=249248 RepID=A0A813YY20_ADIRI|nr:unnamed protein product [Adineta ricciae]CAF0890818.1 unnamed protein product [Adineta ricciae]
MLKITAVLLATLLIVAAQSSIIGGVGGYIDRPELLESSEANALVRYAAEQIAMKDNRILDQIKLTRIQTQVVAGINYKLDFTARPINGISAKLTTCQAVIYVRFDSTRKLLSAQCE